MAEPEVKAKITASDQTAPGVESAKGHFDELAAHGENALKDLGKMALELFAFDKLKEFSIEAVKQFAAIERASRQLEAQVRASGESWEESAGKIDEFLQAESRLYGFTDDQLTVALRDAELKTHNLGVAMKAVDMASKLATAGIGDLAGNTSLLSKVYEGNTRALGLLGRELGLSTEKAKDSDAVFDALAKKLQGVDSVVGDTQSQLSEFSVVWDQTMEDVGKRLASLIPVFSFLEKVVASLISIIFTAAKIWIDSYDMALRTVITTITHVVEAFHGMETVIHSAALALKGDWEGAGKLFEKGMGQVKTAAKDTFKDIGQNFKETYVKDLKDGVGEIVNIWDRGAKKIDVMSDEQFKKQAARNQKAVEDGSVMVDSTQDAFARMVQRQDTTLLSAAKHWSDGQKKLRKGIDETDDHFKQRVESQKKFVQDNAKAIFDALQKGAAIVGQGIASGFEQMVEEAHKSTLSIGKAFEILGKAMFKAIVKGLGEALIQEGVKYLAQAAAALISVIGAPAAPGLFAAGGVLTAAGGTMVGVAEAALAEGGYVTAPTIALLGEDGPEKVTPLSKGHPMDRGGGGDTFHVHQHFPAGVTKAQARGMSRTSANTFLNEWSKAKNRSGNRNSNF